MAAKRILKGRPVLKEGKRIKKIDVRFTEKEFRMIIAMEKQLGITKTELIREKLLHNTPQILVNAKEMIVKLDLIGTEMSRIGNNINQATRYMNVLQKKEIMSPVVAERFNILFNEYQETQKVLEVTLRKIFRVFAK